MASSVVVNESAATQAAQMDPFQYLMQMSSGYMVSAALYVVAKLSIAETLARGPKSISVLASETGMQEDALYRVMRALSSVGIFAEPKPRSFALTPSSDLLRADAPASLRNMVLWMTNKLHFDVWSEMMHSVKTGQPAIEHIHQKACFEVFAPELEHTIEFNNAMTNISQMTIPAVLASYDFSGINTLVDVGGGHGYLLCEIVKKHPGLKGVVFDMEQVLDGARNRIGNSKLSDRVSCRAGNFFETVPNDGDAYIMQHIIHDWADDKALTILRNVRRALDGKRNGKLLVLDSVIKDNSLGDFNTWKDLEMLLMPGGRERTEAEFRDLLGKAGFKITRVIPTPAMVAVIEAVPV
jgi:hypothetical protein